MTDALSKINQASPADLGKIFMQYAHYWLDGMITDLEWAQVRDALARQAGYPRRPFNN